MSTYIICTISLHNGGVSCMNKSVCFWLSILEGFQICKIKKLGMTLAKQTVIWYLQYVSSLFIQI